jgi:hypothetical protein
VWLCIQIDGGIASGTRPRLPRKQWCQLSCFKLQFWSIGCPGDDFSVVCLMISSTEVLPSPVGPTIISPSIDAWLDLKWAEVAQYS